MNGHGAAHADQSVLGANLFSDVALTLRLASIRVEVRDPDLRSG